MHMILVDEAIKLIGFLSGDIFFVFIRGFYGFKSPPNFFIKQVSLFSKICLDKDLHRCILVIFCSWQTPNHLCCNASKKLHQIAIQNNRKLAPEKFLSILLSVKQLGHEFSFSEIKSIQIKIAAIQ